MGKLLSISKFYLYIYFYILYISLMYSSFFTFVHSVYSLHYSILYNVQDYSLQQAISGIVALCHNNFLILEIKIFLTYMVEYKS